jgi:DNA invertase Pin-like site-specific DNA recombinase
MVVKEGRLTPSTAPRPLGPGLFHAMKKPTIPAAILVRVSTQKQETERQIAELEAVAAAKGWTIIETIREHGVSGSSRIRPGLDRVLELATEGTIAKVLVHEVSRVARRNSVAHAFLDRLDDCGVSLYWHAQSIETLLPSGKRNPAAGVMFALLAEMARAERETLVERTRSGLAEARRRGKTLGRPVGTTMPRAEFLAKHADVVKLLKAGQSIRHAAKISGKSKGTVESVKRAMR